MKTRKLKKTDLEQTDTAYRLILDLIALNKEEVQASFWPPAMIGVIALFFKDSGYDSKSFVNGVSQYANLYAARWEIIE